jgi:hypothetical protein
MTHNQSTRRTAIRLAAAAMIAAIALAGPGCKRRKVQVKATDEEPPRMASMISMGDPKAAGQLVTGFYDIEQNAWRWVQKRFSVVLRSPAGAAQKGAMLTLKLTVPEVTIARLQSLTLSASVNGTPLPPETYNKAGEYMYQREVDPKLFNSESVRVDFSLDKAIPPSDSDQRELAVVVLAAGLESK